MSSMLGYSGMALVMTATPLAMLVCNHDFCDTASCIQWHMLGMLASSFFMGNFVSRFGAAKIILTGVALMGASS